MHVWPGHARLASLVTIAAAMAFAAARCRALRRRPTAPCTSHPATSPSARATARRRSQSSAAPAAARAGPLRDLPPQRRLQTRLHPGQRTDRLRRRADAGVVQRPDQGRRGRRGSRDGGRRHLRRVSAGDRQAGPRDADDRRQRRRRGRPRLAQPSRTRPAAAARQPADRRVPLHEPRAGPRRHRHRADPPPPAGGRPAAADDRRPARDEALRRVQRPAQRRSRAVPRAGAGAAARLRPAARHLPPQARQLQRLRRHARRGRPLQALVRKVRRGDRQPPRDRLHGDRRADHDEVPLAPRRAGAHRRAAVRDRLDGNGPARRRLRRRGRGRLRTTRATSARG